MNTHIRTRDDLEYFLNIESKGYGQHSIKCPILEIREKDILYKHNYLLRKTEYHTNVGNRIKALFYKILLRRLQNRYCIHIGLNQCDCGLKIMHLGPILVNGNAIIGKNCAFHINTALVASGMFDDAPIIGDGVVIGVGAVVIGGVTIANNIAIGANAVVTKSFLEENIAIAGIPAKKVSDNGNLVWNRRTIVPQKSDKVHIIV